MCKYTTTVLFSTECKRPATGHSAHEYPNHTYWLCKDAENNLPCDNLVPNEQSSVFDVSERQGPCPVCQKEEDAIAKYESSVKRATREYNKAVQEAYDKEQEKLERANYVIETYRSYRDPSKSKTMSASSPLSPRRNFTTNGYRNSGSPSGKDVFQGIEELRLPPVRDQVAQRRSSRLESYPSPATTTTRPNSPDSTSSSSHDHHVDFIQDEAAEGVWGYLLPLEAMYGASIVLRNRNVGSAIEEKMSFEIKGKLREQSENAASGGGYLIGRHPECDLIIGDPIVSNRHCLIFTEIHNGTTIAIIEDLSSNSTYVNDAVVGRNKRRELKDRDEIAILDKARFIFRYSKASREANTFFTQYALFEKIGKGHFAEVFSCVEKSTGQLYAVKVFTKIPGVAERSKTEGLQREIATFMGIRHPNILYAKASFDEPDAVYLVMELGVEGELFNWIVMKQKLTETETRKVFLQIFDAVKYLHDRNIVYRDIKPENIVIMDKELTIKLMDFGLSKVLGEESFTTTLCGTPSYVAPEILEGSRHRRYSRGVDIWSLGVVLYICLCGFPPFSDELYTRENPYTLTQQIKTGRFDYPSPYWDSVGNPALDLIDRMLVVDVEKRYTIDDCLKHPWTQNTFMSTDDSIGVLVGIATLDFSNRKLARERTLLSSINEVNISRKVEIESQDLAKVYVENPASEPEASGLERKRRFTLTDGQSGPPTKLARGSANLNVRKSLHLSREPTSLASPPSESGRESPPLSLGTAKDGRTSEALKNLHNSAFGDDTRDRFNSTPPSPLALPGDFATRLGGEPMIVDHPQMSDESQENQPGPAYESSSHEEMSLRALYVLHAQAPEPTTMEISPEKSLLDSGDEVSASTDATDISSPDYNAIYSDDDDEGLELEEYNLRGCKPEKRLTDPEEYFQGLKDLESKVIKYSCRWIHSNLDGDHISYTSVAEDSKERMVTALFEFDQILANCCRNITRLQHAGFCGKYITVITQGLDQCSVARLHKVHTDIISQLRENIGEAQNQDNPSIFRTYLRTEVMKTCYSILEEMGLALPQSDDPGDPGKIALLHATVQALDLAVVSYSGTHINRFDNVYKKEGQTCFQLPTIYSPGHEPGIEFCLRRRRLKCMDRFLGGRKVWVFQKGCDTPSNEPMWLSTGIEELNDLWGPCWKLYQDGKIRSIEIGNGSILPWSADDGDLQALSQRRDTDIYSHWISSKNWDDSIVEKGQHGIPQKYFDENSTFLIGASPYTGLAVNSSCRPSNGDLIWKKTRLEEGNALRIPKTSYSRRYKDSHAYQITANIPIAGAHTQSLSYKRQEGLDRKSALVERWRNNSGNPGELEDFSGIEVSICTQNACRTRLLSILGSDTMRDYLHGVSFAWPSKHFESSYFEAMKNRRKFRKFWNKNLNLAANISKAISLCLDILQITGINGDNGELGALWVAEFEDEKYQDYSDDDSDGDISDARSASAGSQPDDVAPTEVRMPFKKVEEFIITLYRSEYTWTGFLRDSPETITVAIVTSNCLESIDDLSLGRRCKRGWWEEGKYITSRGFPVIQTSLFVNESILSSSQLVSKCIPGRNPGPSYRIWNTDGLRETSRFSLGNHGMLEVSMLPTKRCPVTVMRWTDIKSVGWNEFKEGAINEGLLGRSREPHHKEHISGVWETKPLPVLILSKSRTERVL